MISKATRSLFCGIALAFFASLLSSSAHGQFRNAIEGTVYDPEGKIIANAQVVLVNVETGVSQSTRTNAEGHYRFPSLPPGKYKITASAPGFKQVTQENITLGGSEVRTVPITLEVGQVAEQVTVTSEPPPVQLSEAKVTSSLSSVEVRNLPLAGRNVLDLVSLAPGVTGAGNIGSEAGGSDIFSLVGNPNFNAGGQRGEGNVFYVDSTSVTSNPDPGTFNIIPNPDSIQEFNVAVNDYSAEYGRSSSVVIQAVTRSGTNQFHGSLFEFHRDNRLTARNVFQNTVNPLTGRVIPVTRRNEFGGSLGGPIKKDKLFFFFSWDQLRSSYAITRRVTVEHPDFVNFLKTNFPNNISTKLLTSFPINDVSGFEPGSIQTVATVMNIFGLGNCSGRGPLGMPCDMPVRGTAIQDFAPTRNGLQWNARIDWYFNESKDRIYFNSFRKTTEEAGTAVRPAFRTPFKPEATYANIDWTHTFGPSAVNEAAVGFIRNHGNSDCNHCEVPPISAGGLNGFGNGFAPALFIQNDFHWRDILSINRGNHAFKAGVDILTDQENDLFSGSQQRPTYYFLNLFEFAADQILGQAGVNYDLRTGTPSFQDVQYITTTYGFFAQDNWKVRKDFSLNLGLRWDFSSNPYETHGRLSNVVMGSGNTFAERLANASVRIVPNAFYAKHRIGYFAPRLNFAWAPARFNDKLSIRGGLGVFMERWPNIVWSDALRFNPPFQSSVTADRRNASGPQPVYGLCQLDKPPFNCPFPSGLVIGVNERGGPIGALADIGGVAADLRYAYSINRFLGFQYAFTPDWTLEVDYLGSRGVHLYTTTDRNRFAGDTTFDGILNRLNPFFAAINYTDNSGWSDHNGGTISLRKRFSKGYALQATYTFGKTISVSDAIGPGRDSANAPIVDAYNFNAQRGLASFDIPKRFAFSIVYEIPPIDLGSRAMNAIVHGWQLSAIGTFQDGYPAWVVDTSRDFNGDGYFFDPPDTPSYGNSKHCSRTDFLNRCLSPTDFPTPPCVRTDAQGVCIGWARAGTLGRNTFRGPGLALVDFSLMRNFPIPWFIGNEGAHLQLRGEVYNLFNRVNLTNFSTDLSDGNFGRATGVYYPRTIQIGFRIEF